MAKKLEKFDREQMKSNPFVFSLEVPVSLITSNDAFEVHLPKIEGDQITYLNKQYLVEKQQFTRLYYCSGCKAFVYNLSDRAQRLYLYILYNLERKQDYIQLNQEDYMTKNSIKSKITYNSALNELIRYGFIATSIYKTVYWTNPFLFASSDRVQMYPKNLKQVN